MEMRDTPPTEMREAPYGNEGGPPTEMREAPPMEMREG